MSGAGGHSPARVLALSLGFSLALTLVFTLVSNLFPQVEGEAPQAAALDLGKVTMESFIEFGKVIYNGKGTCPLCHKEMGRATDLLPVNVVELSSERLADERYQGQAGDAEGYLRESLLDPGAYVVKGYGVKGSDDTKSPMPAVDLPPILLTPVEIDAVIAYLQSKDGHEVTVKLPEEMPPPPPPAQQVRVMVPQAAKTPEQVLLKYRCQSCHALLGSQSELGPQLNDIGKRMSKKQIRDSILDPDAVIAEGYKKGSMPAGMGDRMMYNELEMLIEFLSQQKGP